MKQNIILFKALSDPTRYKILELLLEGEKCVCEIYPNVKRTQGTVSAQLGKLEDWGMLESQRDGKKIYYKIKEKKIFDIFDVTGNRKNKIMKRCKNKSGKCGK